MMGLDPTTYHVASNVFSSGVNSAMARARMAIIERGSGSEKYRIFFVDVHRTRIIVTVTFTPSVVRKWIRSVLYFSRYHLNRLVVGLGVQWVPDTRRDDHPAAILQLCVGRRCLIFQLQHSEGVPLLLRRFLSNPRYAFVGIWNPRDAYKLSRSRHALEVHRLVDLRHHAVSARGEGLATKSMEEIAKEYLGFEGAGLREDVSRSQWDKVRLSSEQVLQACYDVFVCFEVGREMKIWNKI